MAHLPVQGKTEQKDQEMSGFPRLILPKGFHQATLKTKLTSQTFSKFCICSQESCTVSAHLGQKAAQVAIASTRAVGSDCIQQCELRISNMNSIPSLLKPRRELRWDSIHVPRELHLFSTKNVGTSANKHVMSYMPGLLQEPFQMFLYILFMAHYILLWLGLVDQLLHGLIVSWVPFLCSYISAGIQAQCSNWIEPL